MAIDQINGIDATTGTVSAKIDSSKLSSDTYTADAIILKSGDSLGSVVATSAVNLKDVTSAYSAEKQDVTYNGIEGTVVRVYGLKETNVVTVDGTTAKYYKQRNSSGELTGEIVHVACVSRIAADTDPTITVTDGTPDVMLYGNADGNSSVDTADSTLLMKSCVGAKKRNGSAYELSSNLMDLHMLDVDANGSVDTADSTLLMKSYVGAKKRNGSPYSLNAMAIYCK